MKSHINSKLKLSGPVCHAKFELLQGLYSL